ncbi:translation elongation factor-like protein [Candidatus Thorarchaeota archaeon]|nr:MAG: translation elongation factor-like protein [Candidatus Thorarchaeota archaeon]
MGEKKKIGTVTHYFGNIDVAAIMLDGSVSIGDNIRIEGATTDFGMEVESMQVDRKDIDKGSKGQEIAIKVPKRVRENDEVFLVK